MGGCMNRCVLYSLDSSKPGDMKEFVNMTGVDHNAVRESVLHTCCVEVVWNAQSLHPSEAHTVVVSDVHVKYTVSTYI